MVPDDLAALLGDAVFSRPAMALARAGVTPEVLVRMTHHELRMTPGVGGSWRVIAEACERAGWQLEEGGPELRNGAFHRPQATRPQPAPAFDWQALLDEEGA